MRRRVFWCSYNLDRAVAITLGRPVGINDSDIDVEVSFDGVNECESRPYPCLADEI